MSHIAYHRPASAADAARLAAADPDAKLLAGGQSVVPSLKLGLLAPSALIDLTAIAELRGIRLQGRTLTVGAMTTHAAVAESPEVRSSIPALARLADGIGDRQVRNRGTAGGSLANSDPAADYPAAALALAAIVKSNRRMIAADDFFTGMFSTALEDGEIVLEVTFPIAQNAGYAKFPNPASRYALAGVFVARSANGVRVAVTGAGPCVFREKRMEDALARRFHPEALVGITVAPGELNSDIHASAEYRAHLITVMAKRAVAAALR